MKTNTPLSSVILCADDFAYDAEISAGILELIEQGCLSATSCMVLSPYWKTAAKTIAPPHMTQADIGLHLDFTEFNTQFPMSLSALLMKSHLRQLDAKQLKQSIIRQLDLFELHLGRAPDFIDGHQHVHHLPQIRPLLLEEIQKRYAHKVWIRHSGTLKPNGLKSRVIRHSGAEALRRATHRLALASNAQLLGIYGFDRNEAGYEALLDAWLQQSTETPNSLIMCHPAKPSGTTTSSAVNDAIRKARYVEFKVLGDPKFKTWLDQHRVQLKKGSALLTPAV